MDSTDEEDYSEDIEDVWVERCCICKIYLLDDEMFYDLEVDNVKCEWCWFSEGKHN